MGRKRAPMKKSKRKYGSDDESSGEEWGSAKKKKVRFPILVLSY